MRRMRRFILRNWMPLTVGFLVTAWAVNNQYHVRGYMAVGSEWMITPFLLFLYRSMKNFGKSVSREKRKGDRKRCVHYAERTRVTADARTHRNLSR